MQVYFIDTENVANSWTALLPVMRKNSKVLLFYTKTSPTMRMESLDELLNRTRAIETIGCISGMPGESALDFQLVTELGRRIAEKPDWEYLIVSRDQDYDPVVSYWEKQGIRISRVVPETSAHAIEMNTKLAALTPAKQKASSPSAAPKPAVQNPVQEPPPKTKTPNQPQKAPLPPKPPLKATLTAETKTIRETYKSRIAGLGISAVHILPTVNAMVKSFRNEPEQDRIALFENCLPQFVGTKVAAKYMVVLRPIIEDIDQNGPIPPKD